MVRYQRDEPGELIHVDAKKQGRIPDGGGWRIHGRAAGTPRLRDQRPDGPRDGRPRLGYDYLHIAVDDRSRIAYAEAHRDERKETAAAFITRAIAWFAEHGIHTQRVMTDNGSCYRSHILPTPSPRPGSPTSGHGPTGPRPTARSSDSTEPSKRSGPTPATTCQTRHAWTTSPASSTTTTTTAATTLTTEAHPCHLSTTSRAKHT
ncbi:Mobile element protein [Euzebya pacifica]|uniref:Mobile element protein n=1 Tax=Euzebya pacifica TaxID=1608957 RepID=A0A346XWP8_9ACTN|nr:Mobile element protein [Euzebya pacifica]